MPAGTRTSSTDVVWPPELLIWLSPAFPTGGFAFSHGLERLVETGIVGDRAALTQWLRDLALMGSLRNDLILVATCWRAVATHDCDVLNETAELAVALAPSAERRIETLTQGGGFAAAIDAAWSCPSIRQLLTRRAGAIALPVAVGVATADRAIDIAATLHAYAIGFATNLVSAAIRLSVIGQFDAQRVLAELLPDLEKAADVALHSTLDDLGGAMFLADIASMQHETQHTRLFRS